jgi:hypothetical protein
LWKEIRKGVPALADPMEIRIHPFFKGLDWEQLENKQVPPPMMSGMVEVSSMDCESISCHIHLTAEVTAL